MSEFQTSPTARDDPVVMKHVALGWWSLLLFLSLGLVLEGLHGLKVGWYLDVSNHTRREMLTLAHTHGTLLSLVHLVFAFTVWMTGIRDGSRRRIASLSLTAALVCMPGGFLLGGLFFWGGDPGLGILLVPLGGLFLFVAVLLTALEIRNRGAT